MFARACVLATLMLVSQTCAAQTWRGIVLLRSSRADVKALLGEPKSQGKYVSSYETTEEIFHVYFASGPPCGGGLTNSWRVPAGTVVSVRVLPKKQVALPASVYQGDSYKKLADAKDKTIFYFVDEQQGLRYTAALESSNQWNQISLDVFPREHSPLKCTARGANLQHPPFERYGEISSAMELAILDNFSIQLKQSQNMRGAVIVYTSSSRSKRQAQSKLARIKNYLLNVRKAPRNRLSFSIAGPTDSSMVELYLSGG